MAALPRVLISGAGIAGPIVAAQLLKVGIHPVLVEKASSIRTAGQTLDIQGVARKIVKSMGVEPAIRAASTGEEGTHLVDSNDKVVASFPVGLGPTNEYEIVRHRLAKVFYDVTKEGTEYRFGDSISAIDQSSPEQAVITFESGKKEAFDVVVLADGLGSQARSFVFDKQDVVFKPMNAFSAYFSVPFEPRDGPWSRWWTTTNRRSIWMRPAPPAADEPPATLAAFILAEPNSDTQAKLFELRKTSTTTAEKKAMWAELYRGRGWQVDRILRHLETAEDFHSQEMAQVKIDKWHRGRVVLVGDAASCPSPLSGMGTSSAIVGSYILGQELAKAASLRRFEDVQAAFDSYDQLHRPYVELTQGGAPPPWVRRILLPEGAVGLAFVRAIFRAFAIPANWKWLKRYVAGLEETQDEKVKLGEDDVVRLSVPKS